MGCSPQYAHGDVPEVQQEEKVTKGTKGSVIVSFNADEAYKVFPCRATRTSYGVVRYVPKRFWDRYARLQKQMEAAEIALFRAAGLNDDGDPLPNTGVLGPELIEKTKKASTAEEWDRMLSDVDLSRIQRAGYPLPYHYGSGKRYGEVLAQIKADLRKKKKHA